MPKIVLAFPSAEQMASFVLDCKIVRVETDIINFTLTGMFTDECLEIAFRDYGATLAKAPDFIAEEGETEIPA